MEKFDVELLQEARQQTALKSNGIYSVMHKKWIKEPVAEDIPELDQEAFNKLLLDWQDRARDTKESCNHDTITKFIEDIYDLRKTSITDEGEYGLGNLVFKSLRNDGILDELKEIKNSLVTKELSLESLDENLIKEDKEFGKYKSQFIKQINSLNPTLLTRGKETRSIYNKDTKQMDKIALWDSQLHHIDGDHNNNPSDSSNWVLIQCEDGQNAANDVHKLLHLYAFAEDGKLAQDILAKINSYKPLFIRLIDGKLVVNKTAEDYWQSGGNILSAQALQKLSNKL